MTHVRRRGVARLRQQLGALSLITACAAPSQLGTPMKTNCPPKVELPAVEECRDAAMEITDELLRMCVLRQCKEIEVQCSEAIRKRCKELNSNASGKILLAYTFTAYGSLHLFYPAKETHWCEEPASHMCIVKSVIHELAHSCGWHHGEGRAVPGNDEHIPECDCAIASGGILSCQ
jgi:hypothetical protein